jgi:septal ring factor EnvC (AmiA/AmiB activator)
MKKYVMGLSLLIAVLFTVSPALAQKGGDKKVKKEWKKKAKGYVKNPLSLKSLVENYQKTIDELTKKNNELSQRYQELQAQLDKCENQSRGKDAEIANLKNQLSQCNTALEASKQQEVKGVDKGLIFKVQIGAFQYFNINQYLSETQNFEGETRDNLNKYTIGKFKDYNMADAFKKDIRKMGIKDAWIVAYYDGVRIDMKEAMKRLKEGGSQ